MRTFLLVLALCFTFVTAYADQPTTVLTQMENSKKLVLAVPVIDGANSEAFQGSANKILRDTAENLAKKIHQEGQVSYEVKMNRPSVVGILFKAVGKDGKSQPLYKAVNIDLTSGKTFGLGDFLQEGNAVREVLPANYYDVLFADEGVYTNTGEGLPYTGFTSYRKLAPLLRISDAGRLVTIWKLTQDCADKVLTVPAGSLLALKLTSNPSTGYKWSSKITGGTGNLYELGSTFTLPYNTPKGTTGTPGTEILVFAAQTPGTYTVQMSYGRPWEMNKSWKKFAFQVKVI
ncbi:MAG: protease inhibitor I42 family protein [Acidaminococcaceae bacterium]|jgi:predicted secreted protein|nr:protease inhibitor I42 family protein [Acidaminococcaceae bacterium]